MSMSRNLVGAASVYDFTYLIPDDRQAPALREVRPKGPYLGTGPTQPSSASLAIGNRLSLMIYAEGCLNSTWSPWVGLSVGLHNAMFSNIAI